MLHRRTLMKTAAATALAIMAAGPALAAEEKIKVVATFSILGDMVERIGGDHISLTTLVGPNGDTHVYKPGPTDAKALKEADVLVVNGLEFEGWLDRLVDASGFAGVHVVATNGIDVIAYDDADDPHHGDEHEEHAEHKDDDHEEHADHKDHDHDEHADHKDHDHEEHADHKDHDHEEHADHKDHDHEEHAEHKDDDHEEHAEHKDDDHAGHDHHDHGAFDPHGWQSLSNAVIYVDNITSALAKADPAHAGAYYQNRAAYVAEIEALSTEISLMLSSLPKDARTVVTSHEAFQYFGRDNGLTFIAPQGLGTESEASAKDVARLIKKIRAENIKAVFVENVTDSRLLERIADETDAQIGGKLYPGALSEPEGPAGTYLDMMRHNAKTLSGALGS